MSTRLPRRVKMGLCSCLAGAFLVACPPAPSARATVIPPLCYEQLFGESHLIAIVEPLENAEAADVYPTGGDPTRYRSINTRFLVYWVIKGEKERPKEVTVLHFANSKVDPSTVIVNVAPSFIDFEIKTPRTEARHTGKGTALWLAFLKRRADGRYEATTGDFFEADAFQKLDVPKRLVPTGCEQEGPLPVSVYDATRAKPERRKK